MILEYEARMERLVAEPSKGDTSMVTLTCHMKMKCPPDEVRLAARLLKGPFTITMTSMQADFFKDVDGKDGQMSLGEAEEIADVA